MTTNTDGQQQAEAWDTTAFGLGVGGSLMVSNDDRLLVLELDADMRQCLALQLLAVDQRPQPEKTQRVRYDACAR